MIIAFRHGEWSTLHESTIRGCVGERVYGGYRFVEPQVTQSDLISFRPLSSGAATASARCAARLKGTTIMIPMATSIAM